MSRANGWASTRLKYLADCNRSVLSEGTEPDLTFTYVDISNVKQGEMTLGASPIRFGDAPSRARRLAEPGDIVISTVRTYLRAVASVPRTDGLLVLSTGFAVLHPREGVDSRFLSYYLQGDAFVDRVVARSTGVSYPAITAPDLMSLDLDVPSLDEQRAIGEYLDREIALVDALIDEQEGLVGVLRERRDAIRDRHFFGSDGKRTTTVKRVLRPLSRPAVPGLGVITAYRDGTVTLRSNRRDEGYTFSDTEHGYQEIRPGDLVFHALDGFAGAVGISDSTGNATPVYHVCEMAGDDDPLYVSMLLRYLGVSGFLETQAPNVRERSVDFRNWTTFARVPLSLPSAEEQRCIATEIAAQSRQIDALIAEAEGISAVAKERRSALITAAVTGQIDVRGEVA